MQSIANKTVNNKSIYGTVFSVLKNDSIHTYSSGNISDTTQYFIASITKLYTTTVVLKLRSEGKLTLDDRIGKYLSVEVMKDLHVYKGKDYSNEITIRHLLSQTSGLPDYYEDKPKDGEPLLEELLSGKDQFIKFERVVDRAKKIPPKFAPRADKAHYSDTNWQLLQKIVETITSQTIVDLFQQYIFDPLDLKKTYVFLDVNDTRPIHLYYKKAPLYIPKAISGFNADGGIVSTSQESVQFLKAFYSGELFPKTYLAEMQNWNKIVFPLQYGMGIMRFKLPAIMTGGNALDIIGHAGSSGAFAFYDKEKDVFIAGTVNQLSERSASFKLMAQVLNNL
ncbi:MAG: beta-lactamase family protein [Saprospiraceae bacterium]|nr:beta-lactamase family protein [Saprospiraceae bacterium]